MSDTNSVAQLLQEIDDRQDYVLDQLDELSTRVESLLQKWTRKKAKDSDGSSDS